MCCIADSYKHRTLRRNRIEAYKHAQSHVSLPEDNDDIDSLSDVTSHASDEPEQPADIFPGRQEEDAFDELVQMDNWSVSSASSSSQSANSASSDSDSE